MEHPIFSTILVILLVLAAIVICWQVIVSTQEPHFIIEKDNCSEELELMFLWNDVRAGNLNITHKQILEISYAWLGDYVLECPDNIQDCFLYANKTNCEQQGLKDEM